MPHTIAQHEGVLTVRLDGKVNANELMQDLKAQLDTLKGSIVVIVDFALASEISQPVKATLYRMLQFGRVQKIGFCGVSQQRQADLNDLFTLLARVRPVAVAVTEPEVHQKLGLSQPVAERKLSGMLSYLRK